MDTLFYISDNAFCVLISVCSFLLYSNSINAGYVWDDRAAIVGNADVLGTSTLLELLKHDFWGQNISLPDSHKSYRPITTLSYRLNHSLHGLDAWGFHLGNVFIFSAVVLMVYQFGLLW